MFDIIYARFNRISAMVIAFNYAEAAAGAAAVLQRRRQNF